MSRPWHDKEFSTLHGVQLFVGSGGICDGCENNSAKILYANPENRALALCFSCAEQAYKDGAIKNRYHIDHFTEMVQTKETPKGCSSSGFLWHEYWPKEAR